jgi:hypothetical protein
MTEWQVDLHSKLKDLGLRDDRATEIVDCCENFDEFRSVTAEELTGMLLHNLTQQRTIRLLHEAGVSETTVNVLLVSADLRKAQSALQGGTATAANSFEL